MIVRLGSAVLVCALALVCGCAQRNQAIAAKPTTDELLRLKEKETPIQAIVTIEGRNRQASVRLVPDFKPPDLTPEERAALGEQPLDYKFLPYRDRTLPYGSHVGPWFAGIDTATLGQGGSSVRIAERTSVTGIVGWGGVATWTDPARPGVTGLADPRRPAAFVGAPEMVTIETDPRASTISQVKPYIEK
jgi:hypothetical protein